VPELERSTGLRHNGVDVNVSCRRFVVALQSVAPAGSAPHDRDVESCRDATAIATPAATGRVFPYRVPGARSAEAFVGAERYREPSGGRGRVGTRATVSGSAEASAAVDLTRQSQNSRRRVGKGEETESCRGPRGKGVP